MKRIALIALVVFAASCNKHYTCTCRVHDTQTLTKMEEYDHVSKSTAENKCNALSATLNPPYSVQANDCTLSK